MNNTKSYTFTTVTTEDGRTKLTRINDGYNALELMGIGNAIIQDCMKVINKEIEQPEIIERQVVAQGLPPVNNVLTVAFNKGQVAARYSNDHDGIDIENPYKLTYPEQKKAFQAGFDIEMAMIGKPKESTDNKSTKGSSGVIDFIKRAYENGFNTAINTRDVMGNPYEVGTKLFQSWENGYFAGLKQLKTQ